MVMADPPGAKALASELLATARQEQDAPGEVMALRVLGLALRELQSAAEAAAELRRSVAVAQRHALARLAAESRMSLALVLDDLGQPRAAIREIDRALTGLDGLALARARMQRGILLRRVGREVEALEAYSAALAIFRRHSDQLWQARALTNRGVLQAYRGGLAQARSDLSRAEELYRELGLTSAVAQVQHNQGFVAAQAGDIVSALEWYDRADEHFRLSGGRPAVALIDRASLLLAARLLPEAAEAAKEAVEVASAARLGSLLPQARLLLAQAALAAGDRETARHAAKLARLAFQRQRRDRWTVHARYLELRSSTRDSHRLVGQIAGELASAGWEEQALEARLYAASAGDESSLEALATTRVHSGPARMRIHAWHGRALSRLHKGDPSGAKRALLAGLRLLDEYRAALGATELRVLSSGQGTDLARLGIRLAVKEGQPRQLLAWAEKWRAATLRLRPVPAHDEELTRDLAQLRQIGSELAAPSDPARRQRLQRQQKTLEEAIRSRTWRTTGDSAAGAPVSVDQLQAALGDRALLEIIEQDGELIAIVVTTSKIHLRSLVPVPKVTAELAALRFAMRRLVLRHGSPASLAAADAAARHGLNQLGEWLFSPVGKLTGDRELVIVPTGELQALPWSALPGCAGRPITIAPSATAWWHAAAAATPTANASTVLIGADDPEHAIPEVTALAGQLPQSTLLTGAKATVRSALSAMDGASCAHVAAHGAFRADNPLFSHLSMSDGPLTGHDLAALKRAPELFVLSACDTGLSSVHAGDELMGLTATMLSAGTRTLVASVGPVEDAPTRSLMVDLHRYLRLGQSPAAALATARARSSPGSWATAHSFACFGGGF
jgi:tetratricopeptide (TPR) repeat protein